MTNYLTKSLLAGVALCALVSTSALAQAPASAAPGAMMENAGSSDANPPSYSDGTTHPMHKGMHKDGMMGDHHHWTLDEARKHAHERAAELDKMTQAEWDAKEKARHDEWKQKWDSLTPDQKAAMKAMHGKHMDGNAPPPPPPAQ